MALTSCVGCANGNASLLTVKSNPYSLVDIDNLIMPFYTVEITWSLNDDVHSASLTNFHHWGSSALSDALLTLAFRSWVMVHYTLSAAKVAHMNSTSRLPSCCSDWD